MEWWLVLIVVLSYIFLAVVIGTLVSKIFYKKDWIIDRADAYSFGTICGMFWPALPFILLCFVVVKGIGRLFPGP